MQERKIYQILRDVSPLFLNNKPLQKLVPENNRNVLVSEFLKLIGLFFCSI